MLDETAAINIDREHVLQRLPAIRAALKQQTTCGDCEACKVRHISASAIDGRKILPSRCLRIRGRLIADLHKKLARTLARGTRR
jgi:hypothetical protein